MNIWFHFPSEADGSQTEKLCGQQAKSMYHTPGQLISLMLELIFAPHFTLKRHQIVLENITWELHLWSSWTGYTFRELNLQFQQAPRMTLQNRLALGMLLLKEQGGCGMSNLTDGEHCVTIHDTSTPTEEAPAKMMALPTREMDCSSPCKQQTGLTDCPWICGLHLWQRLWEPWGGEVGYWALGWISGFQNSYSSMYDQPLYSTAASLFSLSVCYIGITSPEEELELLCPGHDLKFCQNHAVCTRLVSIKLFPKGGPQGARVYKNEPG